MYNLSLESLRGKKAFVFFLFLRRRGKNQHEPPCSVLNMRHAATRTRPGVCRIHFHSRHLDSKVNLQFLVEVHTRRGSWPARAGTAHRLGEWISRPRLLPISFLSRLSVPFHTVLRDAREANVCSSRRDTRTSRSLPAHLGALEYVHYYVNVRVVPFGN